MDKWRRRRRGGKVGIMFSEWRRGKEEGERERERGNNSFITSFFECTGGTKSACIISF